MNYAKNWRNAAREALQEGREWIPTNLPNYIEAYKKFNGY